jgi:hypothetical protein
MYAEARVLTLAVLRELRNTGKIVVREDTPSQLLARIRQCAGNSQEMKDKIADVLIAQGIIDLEEGNAGRSLFQAPGPEPFLRERAGMGSENFSGSSHEKCNQLSLFREVSNRGSNFRSRSFPTNNGR